MMYLLQFLERGTTGRPGAAEVGVEHRLLCSGELFNARIATVDWRKGDVTRVLCRSPFELFVTSRPFDAYPQQLCVRFRLNYETEEVEAERASFRRTFLRDDEIVEDLCSVLTLLSRRLIVPNGKTRELHEQDLPALGSFGKDIPLPLTDIGPTTWKRRHSVVVTTGPHEQEVISYQPPAVQVFPDLLQSFLAKLPTLPEAERTVRAARLYREALELIETRPDSAYQLRQPSTGFPPLVRCSSGRAGRGLIGITVNPMFNPAPARGPAILRPRPFSRFAEQGSGWRASRILLPKIE